MTRPIAGNLIPTIIRDSRGTFIFPALNHLVSKRSSQSVADRKESEVAFDFDEQVFDVE